ncbi:hypothetical protein J4E85_002297 [Alternaria conjuncta]|uniref:uncharacterized protein n=1 Tax=Alternaria conjuncta TaxID=181017 RepID=UPI0022201978|nr:uncharacterized protein J4E85_002297 [Alternaria conjuncta]KAI4934440.1 hypothetical protein J4E85_002297 [Alternaria conjuncta]
MTQLNQPSKEPAKARVEELGEISRPTVQSMSLPRPPPNPVSDLMDLVINRESRYTTHSLITSYLGIDDIRNVQLACRKTSDLYADLKKTQWNINTCLQPFFKNIQKFRCVQAQTETLIGSKFAGNFFRRLQVKNELELFTQAGEKADALISYLEKNGYVRDKDFSHDRVTFGASRSSLFTKTSPNDRSQVFITLRHCVHSPIDVFLKCCITSSRACFISWNKAYYLFPTTSIRKRTSYLMIPMSQAESSPAIAAIKRDFEEGFIVKTGEWVVNPYGEASESHPEFASARTAGDNLSWVIKLDTTEITPATAPDSLLDDAQFSMGATCISSIVSYLQFRYDVLASCALQHTYICHSRTHFVPGGGHRQDDYRDQMQYLEKLLNDQTSMQLTMLNRDDRPPQYVRITSTRGSDHTAKGHFTVPPNWNYFDAEIQAELRKITKQLLATDASCLPK